jgi:hypothetical protein
MYDALSSLWTGESFMDILFTACNAALFVGCLLALTRCNSDAKHVDRRRKAFDDGMARIHSLKTEVAALAEANDALASQLAKLRGKFYSTQPRKPRDDEFEFDARDRTQPDDVDPEIAAHLALQTAPPKAPGAQ